jgi:hypothetical protein
VLYRIFEIIGGRALAISTNISSWSSSGTAVAGEFDDASSNRVAIAEKTGICRRAPLSICSAIATGRRVLSIWQ